MLGLQALCIMPGFHVAFCSVLRTGSHYVVQTGFKFEILSAGITSICHLPGSFSVVVDCMGD